MAERFKYIYGPVPSWRVGSSLGIDLLSQADKICSFDCIYCQLGKTDIHTKERKIFIPEEYVIKEIEMLPNDIDIDYITLSGRGEPTLAMNLGEVIKAIKKIRSEKVAVITNSTLIDDSHVQEELSYADFIIAKIDAGSEDLFHRINKPVKGIDFAHIVDGLKEFKKGFLGKLAIQIMFIKENVPYVDDLADMARAIDPHEIQINTPLRPCGVKPLDPDEISSLKEHFKGLNTITVYESEKKQIKPISHKDTLKRRGKI
ncbi:MAG TPA: radical SAM protein [Syntrophorhabdaceae bacterium]|nr:radical SAM protein [Syntrophorhabdaceae bacterium]